MLLFMQLYSQYKRLLVEYHFLLISENHRPILNHHDLALFASAADILPVGLSIYDSCIKVQRQIVRGLTLSQSSG